MDVTPRQASPQRPPQSQPRSDTQIQTKSGKKKLPKKWILFALAAILLLAGIFTIWKVFGQKALINDDRYQAVFLSNGQVYFGKLERVDDEYFRLTDIYYLQVSEGLQAATNAEGEGERPAATNSAPQLIKLGEELHGPEDEMVLHEMQIQFFENLKENGTVSEAIKNDKQN